jgi:AraC-like DNA-binding protein
MKTDRSLFFFWGVDSTRKLYVRSSGDFILVPPDHEKNRTVDFAELFWPIGGQCKFHDGKDHILRPGFVWYYPPGSHHEYFPVKPFHYCWLTIAGEKAGKMFELLDIRPGLNKAGPCPHQLFTALGNELLEHSAKHKLSALSVAFKILIEIGSRPPKDNRSKNAMSDAKKRIETDFGDPALDVRVLAESLHMHRVSFSRAFHKAFDMTVRDYISIVRINNAIDMLSSTSYSIAAIAEECGFRSANYFSKVFFAKVGITPNEYRLKKYSGSSVPKTYQEHTSND